MHPMGPGMSDDMFFGERERQSRRLFLVCSWVVMNFMILAMIQPALAHYCRICQNNPCQCPDSRRTTQVMSELHEVLVSLPDYDSDSDSDSGSSGSEFSVVPPLSTGNDWDMPGHSHTGPSPTAQGSSYLSVDFSSLGSGLSSIGASIPIRTQPFTLHPNGAGPVPPHCITTSPHSLMEERTTGSQRLLPHQIIQRLQRMLVRIQALVQRRSLMIHDRKKEMANIQYQLLSEQDWIELGISMEEFTAHISGFPDQPIEHDPLVSRVEKKILDKGISQASNEYFDEQEGDRVDEALDPLEVELSEAYIEFFSLLNQRLSNLSALHGVTMITRGWNPYALKTLEPIPLMELVRHFLEDYHPRDRSRSAPVCPNASLEKFQALSAPLTETNGYYHGEPTSGHIASTGFLDLLGGALLSLSHYHVLSLIHLNTISGQEHDTVVLLSDGTNLWFGSQHLGGYYSHSMTNTINFLRDALRLLNTLFDVNHFTINTRYL